MVISVEGYCDIHYKEGGCYCYLYYSRERKKNPIKNLTFASYKEARTDNNEVAKNSYQSMRGGDLDLAARRGYKYMKSNLRRARYNYIYIERC
jgi:hypothetical protein